MNILSPALMAATVILAPLAGRSQATMADVLNGKTRLTFLGLDLSEAQFTTQIDFAEVSNQGALYFRKWNGLLQSEWEKFNLAKPLKLASVPTDVSIADEANDVTDVSKAWAAGNVTFDKEQIPAMVRTYKTGDKEGAGCVFIVGSFNKPAETADMYVTFLDLKTKEVLHVERVVGEPRGFGLRNYWAGAVTSVLEQIDKRYRKEWHAKYLKG